MAQVLKISDALNLAFHAMTTLTLEPDRLMSNSEIASQYGVSENHLSKVMQRLVKAGLVRSVRGPKGGFHLARPAEEITMLDVFEAIEGEMEYSDCLFESPLCGLDSCILGNLLNRMNREVKQYFEKTTLAEFRKLKNGGGSCADCGGA